jgi:hypothetical protein
MKIESDPASNLRKYAIFFHGDAGADRWLLCDESNGPSATTKAAATHQPRNPYSDAGLSVSVTGLSTGG